VGPRIRYNERHSRDKIENFLTECGTSDTTKRSEVQEAWKEYRWLLRSEKTLAYKFPKQVRGRETI
jgi:hypothetical protein